MVNFFLKGYVAVEGAGFSETMSTNLYCQSSLCLIDTQGTFDTGTYTNEDLLKMLKADLLQQSLNSISAIIILDDPTQNRLFYKESVEMAIHLFGEKAIHSLVFVMNKANMNKYKEGDVRDFLQKDIGSLYNNNLNELNQRTVFLNTKGDFNTYFPVLNAALARCSPLPIQGIHLFEAKVQEYYQQELKNPDNYRSWTDAVVTTVVEKVNRVVEREVSYTEECNCQNKCVMKFLRCWKRRRVCETCARSRKISETLTEEVPKSITNFIPRSELKVDTDVLLQRARVRVVEEIRKSIYPKPSIRK